MVSNGLFILDDKFTVSKSIEGCVKLFAFTKCYIHSELRNPKILLDLKVTQRLRLSDISMKNFLQT